MTIPLREIPRHDRPRERLFRDGTAALSDAELVAVHLGSGVHGANAVLLAQRLLSSWGGVAGLARARPEELAREPGIGPAKAARLLAAFGLAARASTPDARIRLAHSRDIAREATRVIGRSSVERVVVFVADSGLRLRRTEVVATGSASECPVPVREILATVLRHDGVAFAIAHNHPGGDPTPSAADYATTDAIARAARATGLRFLDHVVVAGDAWQSACV